MSLLCGIIYYTYWFSYILFLVIIGGILILFIYITSLASNELFNLNINNFFITLFIFLLILIINYFYDNFLFLIKNFEINSIHTLINNNENAYNLIKLYNNPTINITIIIINYLLLTLIIVVKITDISYGPLRQKN